MFGLNKKGAISGRIMGLIGALVVIVVLTSLAPTFFSGANATAGPSWLDTVLPVIIASGVILVAWRAFAN